MSDKIINILSCIFLIAFFVALCLTSMHWILHPVATSVAYAIWQWFALFVKAAFAQYYAFKLFQAVNEKRPTA